MDFSKSINLNTLAQNPLFDFKSLRLQYFFDQFLGFLSYVLDFVHKSQFWSVVNLFFSLLAIFFITIISYCAVRILEIRKKEHLHLEHLKIDYAKHQAEIQKKLSGNDGKPQNARWESVLKDLFTDNPGDWKIAIIEADAMLEGLLDQLKYKGENLGEKLKSADKSKFHSLNSAWEAHLVRNRIAHEGSKFELSHHEAKRIISLYEQVFREFSYI